MIHWRVIPAQQLTPPQLSTILQLRNQVFIVEQQCPYQDIDGADLCAGTLHLCGWRNETLLAYARLLGAPQQTAYVKIGRVIVAPEARGQRLGHALLEQALTCCAQWFPARPLQLSAQAHLTAFYAQFGFQIISAPYDEDGIPHVDMRRER